MPKSRLKAVLALLITLLWLAALLWAYWWFQVRYVRSFDNQAVIFAGESLRLPQTLAAQGTIRLVHFWDPACPCNVGNQQHLSELIERFAGQGVSFHVLQKPGSSGTLPAPLAKLQPIAQLQGAELLPSSPAVGIWDQQGQLAYFGPYSEGVSCNSSNSFIEPILEALIEGRTVKASNSMAIGCFCPWQPETK